MNGTAMNNFLCVKAASAIFRQFCRPIILVILIYLSIVAAKKF